MEDSGFSIVGWDAFVEQFSNMIDNWESEKQKLLNKIGNIIASEVMPFIPVDTSRLVDSFFVNVQVGGAEDFVEYGSNVEYALFVNDGHVQHKRFLPASYLDTPNGRKYLSGNAKGIMLSEKYITGKHFMENGMSNAKPRIERLADDFMRTMFIKYGLEP